VRNQRSRTAARDLARSSARIIDDSVITITSAPSPVQAYCSYGNSRADVMITTTPAKAFETTARTVIAWFPPPSALRRGADGSVAILPPSGWAVCDGTKGTSDLSDRFIIDCSRNEKIGSSGGSATHKLAGADYGRGFKIDPADPALFTLIYIMKL